MALAYANKGATTSNSTAATSVTLTLSGGSVAVGSTILVACGLVGASPTSVTDNASPANTYVQIAPSSTNTETITLFAAYNIAHAPTTVTMNMASSRYGIAVEVYTGVLGFSVPKGATTGSASPATITASERGTNNFIIGAFANKGTATWSSSTGTLRRQHVGAATTTPGVAFVENTAGTTVAAAESGSNVWGACCIELLSATNVNGLMMTGSGM